MPRTAVVAGLSLVVGFGLVQLTGQRYVGGVVLLGALVWCAVQWSRRSALAAVGLSLLYVGAFIGSHLLARLLPAWPAVILAAAALGLAVAAALRERADEPLAQS